MDDGGKARRSSLLSPRGERGLKKMGGLLSPRSVSLRQIRRRNSSEEFGSKSSQTAGPGTRTSLTSSSRLVTERNAPGPLHTRPASPRQLHTPQVPPRPLHTRPESPRDTEWHGIQQMLEHPSECDTIDLLDKLLIGPIPEEGTEDEALPEIGQDDLLTSTSSGNQSTQFDLELDPAGSSDRSLTGSQESGASDEPFPGIPLWTLSDKVQVRKVTKEWSGPPPVVSVPEPAPEHTETVPVAPPAPPAPKEEEASRPTSGRGRQGGRGDTVTKLLAGMVSLAQDDLRGELGRVHKDHREDQDRARKEHKKELDRVHERYKDERDRAQNEIDQLRQEVENERDNRDEIEDTVHRSELEIQKLRLNHTGMEAALNAAVKEKELAILETDLFRKSTEGTRDQEDLLAAHEEHINEISQENAVLASENKLLLAQLAHCTCGGAE